MTCREESFPHLGPEGFHRVAYREWGERDNPRVLLCVHGISRNARDFDDIAAALGDRFRVLCPDMPGRGASDWMTDKTHYAQPLYLSVCAALIARSGAETVSWIGTSMGGRIGMDLASRDGTPIERLVINDIGPHVPESGRRDNFAHFGTDPRFATEADGIAFVRETRAAFGPTTEAAWTKFCRDSLRRLPDGQWTLHYDPGLAVNARKPSSTDTWDQWERIRCPVLVLWGMKSKILPAETVERMRNTGPRARVFEVPYAGHCPRLENDEQIAAVRDFLLE
jgi:pimeloyl-ACP methyl ester carboxylesterase